MDAITGEFVKKNVRVNRAISHFDVQTYCSNELVVGLSGSNIMEKSSKGERAVTSRDKAIVIPGQKVSLTTPRN